MLLLRGLRLLVERQRNNERELRPRLRVELLQHELLRQHVVPLLRHEQHVQPAEGGGGHPGCGQLHWDQLRRQLRWLVPRRVREAPEPGRGLRHRLVHCGDTFAYGGIDGEYEVFGESVDMYVGPYVVNPRRHIQFSFALLSWKTDPVHQDFDAQCDVSGEDGGDCNGMWYQLPQTKRYLFAGTDVLPVDDIMAGDFHSPTPLVQLNAPSVLIQGTPTELEYLNLDNFASTQWNASLNEMLTRDACSSLMESYLAQLEDNKYSLERPLEVMYSSVFFFFMQNAAVTDLSSSSSSSSTTKSSTSSDLLANVQLKGDRQLRRIAMSIPANSFWISFVGCMALVAVTFVILIFPTQRAEYFEPGTTTAERYVALKTSADYPDLVYKKMLVPAKTTGADPPTMDAFRVESMTLVHRTGERTQHIEL